MDKSAGRTELPELATAEAYYEDRGDGNFRSSIHAQGAWNEHEQHMAPASGIIAHCLARHEPREDMRIARISFEILGLIPGGDFEIVTSTVRPGKTIELVQAELAAGGRVAIRATAWRLTTSDTSAIAATEDPSLPLRAECARWNGYEEWPGGFIRSIEAVQAPGHRPGRGKAWIRPTVPLVDGVDSPDWVRLLGVVDATNGIATRVPAGASSWLFPNVDLQIHMYREPRGEWLGIDNSVTFGADGIGLTSSILHDEQGPFGRSEQILTLRKGPNQS
ncbi:thioesterase family protein [Kocuria sp. TGY1127_2]|uniref:thioesterase family protein n=1 Tax=Kocuria sp. TGY1127_2 TaxID=2711328 RepID=UPI0015B89514|nr:thioesterase family protein [Kocuria sp. TGY1127_2]